ncbi:MULTISPECIES: DUF2933 domain-containing protein [Bacillus]|uniref:DUF2933 domain-containing protein n=1 Tax=Bacillus TaxID=1386 RepID=UPI000779D9B8|nr:MULTISPECIES: DUF2933 domain-containing protein [Bacillus]MBS2762936.1 DUF2933 domain-containing protein [Bacillus licheniformis]MCM2581671.1 DUF2933 domain-containing protein [Bacillus stercoris]MEC2289342.1 DUF2933 domain-containing protein [Bacillus licheniformis]MED4325865.1 DUF2933 domain-containing protein [Bacillus licheniformis]MED4336376.1 DUF2933 domain-containing protein [Bacillus licheniformis]
MTWLQILLFLACPLMMLFCMKGMFSGHKDKNTKTDQQLTSPKELQTLQKKMAELIEQNHKLTKEKESLKDKSPEAIRRNVKELKRIHVKKTIHPK